MALSKKCTSVYDGEDGGDNEDGGDGEDGEDGGDGEDGEGDDKHDYLPTEDGARCPASCNTTYNTIQCVFKYNTIQVSYLRLAIQ